MSLDDDFAEFRSRVFKESASIVEFATAPVAVVGRDGSVTLDRSGILLAIGEHHFLVTAEHRLESLSQGGFSLMILAASQGGQSVQLRLDRMIASHSPTVDLAVIPMDDSASCLEAEYRFLRLDDVRLEAPRIDEGHCFMVAGFPAANLGRDQAGVRCVTISRYLTMRYDGDLSLVDEFSPASHIVLCYDRDSHHETGHVGPPPAAPGLSGCGIWYLPTPYGIKHWTARDIKLVGIQTSWLRHEYLKGTIIAPALSMIWYSYPDACAPMRIHGIEF